MQERKFEIYVNIEIRDVFGLLPFWIEAPFLEKMFL